MLRELFVWWTGQLRDLLPARWMRLGSTHEDALVIEPMAALSRDTHGEINGIDVNLRRHGRETSLGHFSLSADTVAELPRPPGNRIVLRLRQEDVLAKTVTLPIAA